MLKNFKKLFAIIFIVAVVVFGVLVMIDERDLFNGLKDLSFENWYAAKISIALLLILIADVLLIALPALGFVLVLSDKFDPFKAIVDCALVVLGKFILSIIAIIVAIGTIAEAAGSPFDWNAVFFGKDTMLFIPTLVFGLAFIFLIAGKASNFEGTLTRAVLSTIGSGLGIFGMVFYFILGGGTSGIMSGQNADALTIFGLILGIACFGGIVAYSFLPQTREFSKE